MTEEIPSAPDESGLISLDRHPTAAKEAAGDFSLDHKLKHLRNTQFAQDIRERKLYARYAYRLTSYWIRVLIVIIFLQMGCRVWGSGLRPEEFIAVVTTTTASVFGFWWLVGRYLFKGTDKQPGTK